MIINCAIIDDEPLAAGLLKSYAEKTPFLHLIGSYGSALEAMKELRDHPVQLYTDKSRKKRSCAFERCSARLLPDD